RLALAQLHSVLAPEVRAEPPELAELLAGAARRAGEPLPFPAVEKVLRAAWGGKVARELDDLDAEPAAVTPAAQVHRGLLDGAAVAVKVRRPGLTTLVRSDLGVLDALAGPLRGVLPAVDPAAILREVRERALDELDLEHEGSVQQRFARALRRDPLLHVPAVTSRLTHDDVLVSAWVEGRPLRAVAAGGSAEDRARLARAVVRFFAGAARFGIVHADPHPDDVLLMADGRVAVLDFGATRPVAPDRADRALAAFEALGTGDAARLGAAAGGERWTDADSGTALAVAMETLGPLVAGPALLDLRVLDEVGRRTEPRLAELVELAGRSAAGPEDLWPLRSLGGLVLLLARLGAREDWVALTTAALRDGWRT
ncbi:MAG TPA: AarF/UbiB family protein, partial [Solirubrobacteraceae bacterium]|nr:AarF/UbiB family protein [Solirubrobacteraceae bacterium]